MPLRRPLCATTALFAALLASTDLCSPEAIAAPRSMTSSITHRPEHVGQCFRTRVLRVENRLRDTQRGMSVPGSGSKLILADGHINVNYSQDAAIDRSMPGDPVRLCVLHLPVGCPTGDTRNIVYKGINLRTGLSWESSDSTHNCDGA